MDPASQALAQTLPPNVRRTYAALAAHSDVRVSRTTLWYRAKGRPSRRTKAQGQQYLTPLEEKGFAQHLIRAANFGLPWRIKDIPSLAFSIARRRSPAKAIKPPNKNWPQAFAKRHPELARRKHRAMDWNRHDKNIYDKATPEILPQNVYNMDETGIMLSMLSSVKVLVGRDDLRDYRGAGVKRTMVTAIECVSASGECLNPMIIWPASTHRSNWTTYPTPGWVYAHSESGYNDSYLSLEWMKRVFDPQTKARAGKKPRVLICDGFGTHETLEILEFCFENNIVLCRLPSHTSHKLQPCDVAVFGPLKAAYRDMIERLYRSGVTVVNKEHFTTLYSPAREQAMTKKNILAGWAKTGLFPFNPERVLRDIVPPDTEVPTVALPIRAACEGGGLNPQCEAAQTPVTPVTSEALTSLLTLIKQDPYDEQSARRHQKLVQKLANAAQISFTQQALDQDHIRFLSKMNDEAKTRRKTKSEILGKARVMSYEDIEAARAKRAKQTVDKKAKGKRKRRQPQKPTQEAEGSADKGGRKR
ncbi:DDE-domain-containing protein [Lophiostoma macrostomum CBS 122681]|uniref:DDE-domain-containing protein n=1 Tax=Lophiostoma macrostomum CBS 122681 TaxID=1314788 RepID=A0A6A6SXI1_9PLEO|nr:DDE-domain-containing protein [Lophiostoma macrostomum CBS 122681]